MSQITSYMPLLNACFVPGTCERLIDSVDDEGLQDIARAEYYYLLGRHREAVDLASGYLDSSEELLRLSAWTVYIYGNLPFGEIKMTPPALEQMQRAIEAKGIEDSEENQITWVLLIASVKTLCRLSNWKIPNISDHLKNLPESMKSFGCFLMAYEEMLEKNYEKSIGIVEASLARTDRQYPVLSIYLYLVAAVDAINLKNPLLGKTYFMKAWVLARADHILGPIGEYHGMLQGLVESCIRTEYPEAYKEILEISSRFAHGWAHIHAPEAAEDVGKVLTGIEFSVAMLASRKWTNQEIADYLDISIRTVKYHITSVFNKLNINSRRQLSDYLPE